MTTVLELSAETLWSKAREAGQTAAETENTRIGIPETQRGLDCGFAWININPAKGAFVQYLKNQNLGSKGYPKGLQIWYSKIHNIPTQSISVHMAAAQAAAQVLREHGVNAQAQSRLD